MGPPNHRRRFVKPRVDQIDNVRAAEAGPSGKKIDAMQVTETLAEGLKHEFQISVPASDIDAKVDARLVDLKDKVRLNGFRPGKVPVSHLKKVYGRSVMAETIEQTIRDTNTQIFTERGFRLATEPKVTMPTEEKEVEDILSGKSDLTYTVVDRGRAGDRSSPISRALPSRSRSPTSPTPTSTRPSSASPTRTAPMLPRREGAKAENGDRVTVSFKGSIDGTPFDGGTGEDIQVVIGSEHLHSRLRGAADRHRGRRDPHPEGLVPEELRQREAGRPGRPSSRPPRPLIEAPQDTDDR